MDAPEGECQGDCQGESLGHRHYQHCDAGDKEVQVLL